MWRVLKKLKEFLVWAVMGFFVIAISISRTAGAEQTSSTELCEGIIIKDGELSLSESDRILVCGTGKKPWGKPAPAEAKKYLKATLQKRGYHHPEFSTSGKVLVVVLGKSMIVLMMFGFCAIRQNRQIYRGQRFILMDQNHENAGGTAQLLLACIW